MRIKVSKNGPYQVEAGVPVLAMAPVITMNDERIAWHVLRESERPAEAYYLCRCGGSSDKPFCDGTHEEIGFDGAEMASREPYASRAEVSDGPFGQLADDRSLCIGASFCHTKTTSAWELAASDDEDDRDDLAAMVGRCPSGRLVYRMAGRDVEPELEPSIAAVPGGPLWVRGGVVVEGVDGQEWEVANRRTLCRCGASENKPFCDGSHVSIDFDAR